MLSGVFFFENTEVRDGIEQLVAMTATSEVAVELVDAMAWHAWWTSTQAASSRARDD